MMPTGKTSPEKNSDRLFLDRSGMAEPFKRLVKLVARAFYDDFTVKGDYQPRAGRSDNRGLGVVVLDALTRRQWVREEDLARSLKVNSKLLRRILRFFEEEKLVNRFHRKESVKSAKISGEGPQVVKEGDEKTTIHTHSYCCLDYAQIYDVVRYRLHRMRKKLRDQLEGGDTVRAYVCPNCSRRYSAFDALQLVSPDDDYFHCEFCNGVLVAESEKIAVEEVGEGDGGSQTRLGERLKEMLRRMEEQLKPLTLLLGRLKDLPVPDFGTLQSWEARVNAARRADLPKSVQVLGFSGPPPPCIGETNVEVRISGIEVNLADVSTTAKVMPPWMMKQGMSLSREQHGEASELSASSALIEDELEERKESSKSLQEEYAKAFYEAYARRQMELVEAGESQPSTKVNAGAAHRRVGVRSKREELDWEEASPPDISEEDEDEELEWEEG